jgi:hypothetical protein
MDVEGVSPQDDSATRLFATGADPGARSALDIARFPPAQRLGFHAELAGSPRHPTCQRLG